MSEGSMNATRIVGGCDAWVVDNEGRRFIDLCMGYGSVWLGHNNPAVNATLTRQLETYAAPGFLATDANGAILLAIMLLNLIVMLMTRHILPVLNVLLPILGAILGVVQVALGLQIIISSLRMMGAF